MKNPIKPIQDYVRSSWAELKKVSWPSRQTTIRYSTIVIIVCLLVAAFFATLDFGFGRLVTMTILQVKGNDAAEQIPAEDVVPTTDVTDIETSGDGNIEITPVGDTSGEVIDATPQDGSVDLTLPPIE